jgi:hypothetical protein
MIIDKNTDIRFSLSEQKNKLINKKTQALIANKLGVDKIKLVPIYCGFNTTELEHIIFINGNRMGRIYFTENYVNNRGILYTYTPRIAIREGI